MKKRTRAALLALSLCVLAACGDGGGEQTQEQTPSPTPSAASPEPTGEEPYTGAVNPLTGLPMDERWVNARPVAVMLNNLSAALPQQGNAGADIIYEVVAEGGITRMLGVYQTTDGVDTIGSVRSARPYYIELALGHDAIYIHAGGSEDAYANLANWGVDHLDGVRGTYSGAAAGLFWRDRERVAGNYYAIEHSLVTSGDAVQSVLADSGLRLEHEEGYTVELAFVEDGAPQGGESAQVVRVPLSGSKTTTFRYQPGTGYLVEEYGEAYIDGNTGGQIAVTNVLALRAKVWGTGDAYGHMTVDLSGGDGWFACGGQLVPITWEKSGRNGQLRCFTQEGDPLPLGQGKSYVCVTAQDAQLIYE